MPKAQHLPFTSPNPLCSGSLKFKPQLKKKRKEKEKETEGNSIDSANIGIDGLTPLACCLERKGNDNTK